MADEITGIVEQAVSEKVVDKISPTKRLGAVLKKILFFIITLKWILETGKMLGKMFISWFDMVRQATLLQLSKKYTEEPVWKPVLWMKFWRYLYGIVGGILLQYYFDIFSKVDDWIRIIIDVIG